MFLFVVLSTLLPRSYSLSAICFGDLKLDLPARLLFIQLVENGKNLTESRGPIEFSLDIIDGYKGDIIDRGDGLYIFRLTIYKSIPQTTVLLQIEKIPLCGSPLIIIGYNERNLNPETCDCPMELLDWIRIAQCPVESQIKKDFEPFPSINFTEVLTKVEQTWGKSQYSKTFAFCHYQIINNRAYRKCYGEYVLFNSFVDKILSSVLRKIRIPNIEFIFNLGDYPLSASNNKLPIISWCGSEDTFDIVFPTYIYTNQIIDGTFFNQIPYTPWEKKKPKAVFRGRDSNELRLKVAKISHEEPTGNIDAGITAYFFFNEKDETPKKDRMNFYEFFEYRYIISIDGTVAAYRFPNLMLGTSVIFKSDSNYYEHFYKKMAASVHYILFNEYNLKRTLILAERQNFNKTLQNQRQFVIDHLQPKAMYCYISQLLKTYSERLTHSPMKKISGLKDAEGIYTKCICSKMKQEL